MGLQSAAQEFLFLLEALAQPLHDGRVAHFAGRRQRGTGFVGAQRRGDRGGRFTAIGRCEGGRINEMREMWIVGDDRAETVSSLWSRRLPDGGRRLGRWSEVGMNGHVGEWLEAGLTGAQMSGEGVVHLVGRFGAPSSIGGGELRLGGGSEGPLG